MSFVLNNKSWTLDTEWTLLGKVRGHRYILTFDFTVTVAHYLLSIIMLTLPMSSSDVVDSVMHFMHIEHESTVSFV